ncbi:MAG TPA: DUF1579 family protein [Anaeromyxobacteraceae bacterium]|jgi:hypothetical protein
MATMRNAVSLAVGLVLALPAAAQAPKAPAPGPEHEKLGYFVGKWKTEGVLNENPFMPAGKMTSQDSCEWFDGKFALVCSYRGKGPMGPSKGLGIMGYSAEEKVYTYYAVDNSPMAMLAVPRGTVEGDVWTYVDESKMGGKVVKSRYVIRQLDKKSYAFKWEIEGPDGQWKTISEGKSTRAK